MNPTTIIPSPGTVPYTDNDPSVLAYFEKLRRIADYTLNQLDPWRALAISLYSNDIEPPLPPQPPFIPVYVLNSAGQYVPHDTADLVCDLPPAIHLPTHPIGVTSIKDCFQVPLTASVNPGRIYANFNRTGYDDDTNPEGMEIIVPPGTPAMQGVVGGVLAPGTYIRGVQTVGFLGILHPYPIYDPKKG